MTSREADVLALLARGLSNKAVAKRLALSPFTVRTHRQNLMQKLGAHSVVELVAIAQHFAEGRYDSD